jgi:autophagy-related protein 16
VIISGHLDSNIRFWDSRSGMQIREIIGTHAAQITGLCMFSDFTKVLTTSRDNTLKVFDVRTFSPVLTIT